MSDPTADPTHRQWPMARYHPQAVHAYCGNPFIEALPPMLTSRADMVGVMARYPYWSAQDCDLDPFTRVQMAAQARFLFQPLQANIDLFCELDRLIRNGYAARNPVRAGYDAGVLAASGRMLLDIEEEEFSGQGKAIIGMSGLGKSMGVIRALRYFPRVITHTQYAGRPFIRQQIVWLKLDCPPKGSVKSLCIEFFAKVDELLKTNYRKSMARGASENSMKVDMARIAGIHGLGLLIIDEVQDLLLAGGSEAVLLAHLVRLMNAMGIPVVFVGTNKAIGLLTREFRKARRSSSFGSVQWHRMRPDRDFVLFCRALQKYQYLEERRPLDGDVAEVLYDESQGIAALAVAIFIMAQTRAILDQSAHLKPVHIRSAALDDFGLLRAHIDLLRKGYGEVELPDVRDLVDRVEDMAFAHLGRRSSEVDLSGASADEFSPAESPAPAVTEASGAFPRPGAPAEAGAPSRRQRRGGKAGSACVLVQLMAKATEAKRAVHEALVEHGFIRPLGDEGLAE